MQKTREQVSYNMSKIRSKDSVMEKAFGKAMWKAGIRYKKHYKKLVGVPDFVLVKYKIAIFCDSEFWHGYNWGEKRKSRQGGYLINMNQLTPGPVTQKSDNDGLIKKGQKNRPVEISDRIGFQDKTQQK